MQEIQHELECAARSDAKVLITGESGVGKEVVARLIHQQGRRRDAPFIALNCAGVSESALSGCLEQAHGGTVFLDEVGELSLPMQVTLLRFLEHGDVRIIASTKRNLHAELSDEQFREDLYYRLNVIHIVIPPLRDRKEDLSLLVTEFIRTSSQAHGFEVPTLLTDTRDALLAYSWPGNVRELKHVADRMVIGARSGVVRLADLPSEIINIAMQPGPSSSAQPVRAPSTTDRIFERMTIDRESFWAVVYEPFMARTLTRRDLRRLIVRGLQQTRGNYRLLVQLFNVDAADCKRFLSFLHKHECHRPLQKFRSVPVSAQRVNRRARRSLTKAS